MRKIILHTGMTFNPEPTYNKSAADDYENILAKLWDINKGTINEKK